MTVGCEAGDKVMTCRILYSRGGLLAEGRSSKEGVDRFIDLRVEAPPRPIRELQRLLEIHKRFYGGTHERVHGVEGGRKSTR